MTYLDDVAEALQRRLLWQKMAWIDIKQRYRRSWIGPFWLTIGMGIMIATLAVLYANLFRLNLKEFLPFIASGFVIWIMISTTMMDSCNIFLIVAGFIRQIKLPFMIYIFRIIFRNFIVFLHNAIVLVLVILLCSKQLSWVMLLAIPGLLMIMLNLIWMSILIAMFCTRYRDFAPIIGNLIQIFFFITPINWMPSLLKGHLYILTYNPFYYLIEIFRLPLLNSTEGLLKIWLVSGAVAVAGFILAAVFFQRYRSRIIFWL